MVVSEDIGVPPDGVGTEHLQDDAVTAPKIAAGSVAASELATNAVETLKIKDNQVTPPKLSGFVNLEYVGSDLTEASIGSSTAETTIASVTIAADTISTGALYIASLVGKAQAGAANQPSWDIKSGVAASEASRETFTLNLEANNWVGACIAWYDTVPNWTADVSVIITGTNSDNHANSQTNVLSLVVFGH